MSRGLPVQYRAVHVTCIGGTGVDHRFPDDIWSPIGQKGPTLSCTMFGSGFLCCHFPAVLPLLLSFEGGTVAPSHTGQVPTSPIAP